MATPTNADAFLDEPIVRKADDFLDEKPRAYGKDEGVLGAKRYAEHRSREEELTSEDHQKLLKTAALGAFGVVDIPDKLKPRYEANKKSGWDSSLAGIISNDNARLLTEVKLIERLRNKGRADYEPKDDETASRRWKELEPRLTEYRQKRSREIAEEMARPNWYDEPKFLDKVIKGGTSLAGNLRGGFVSPENFIPAGKGVNLFRTFMRGASLNGSISATSDLVNQIIDIELGIKKEIDWNSVLLNGGVGAGVGGPLNMMGGAAPKTATPDPIAEKIKSRVPSPDDKLTTENTLNTMEAEGGGQPQGTPSFLRPAPDQYPRLADEFLDEPHDILKYEPASARYPSPEEGPLPHLEGMPPEPINPPPVDQPLPKLDGEPEIPTAPPVRDVLPENDTRYPILEDYPAPFMDQLGPDVHPQNTMNNPYIRNAAELEVAQAHPDPGAHSEMKLEPEVPPSGELTQGPPGTRSFDDGVMQDIENKRFAPNLAENYPNHHHPAVRDPSALPRLAEHSDSVPTNPNYLTQMWKSQTVRDSLAAIAEHGTPAQKRMAEWMMKFTRMLDTPVHIVTNHHNAVRIPGTNETARGMMGTRLWTGDRDVYLNMDRGGLVPSTVLHEVKHLISKDAHSIAQSSVKTDPDYHRFVAYHNEVKQIMKLFKSGLFKLSAEDKKLIHTDQWHEIYYALSQPEEFDAQMSSMPIMRALAEKMEGRGLWQRLKDAWYKLLGINKGTKEQTLFDRFILNEAKLDDQMILGPSERDWILKDAPGISWLKDKPHIIDPNEPPDRYIDLSEGKDLVKGTSATITPNQVVEIAKHPVAQWFMGKMGSIHRNTAVRFHDYKEQLRPHMFDKQTKLSRKQQLNVLKTLTEIQSPHLKEARAAADASPETRRAFLEARGLVGQELDFALTALDIMRDVYTKDAKQVESLGRKLDNEPMYFPRSHGGKFMVKVFDADGKEQFVKGFDNYKEARRYEHRLRNGLVDREDLRVAPVEMVEKQGFGDTFATILSDHQVPLEWFEKAFKSVEKARETAPWSFEKRRRETEVGGYVGEELTTKADEEALLKLLSYRLMASRDLENKARMLNEIKYPLSSGKIADMPRLAFMLQNIMNRELGVDVTGTPSFDKGFENARQVHAKLNDALAHFTNRYIRGKDQFDFRWDDPRVSKDEFKNNVRALTYFTSVVKLGLNMPVLATNAAQPTLLGLDGIRTAAKEGLNTGHAMTAMIKTMAYVVEGTPEAKAFMAKARREGMVEPHGQEHYTTAVLPDRSTPDRIVQYPRDRVEEFTNFSSILYYYHFFKEARPDLKGEAFDNLVYRYARSFTGQYDQYNTPIMFDKMGTIGQALPNFAKWHFNQLGRFLDDIKHLGHERTAIPLLMTGGMALLSAGLAGLPVVVEYEAIRRLGQETGGWDLPPISALGSKIRNTVPGAGILERGIFTHVTGQMAGDPDKGIDLSNSMKHAAFFDTPTVAIQFAWDVMSKWAPWALKEADRNLVGGPGASRKEWEDMVKSLPPAVKPWAKEAIDAWRTKPFFKEKIKLGDGKVLYRTLDPSDDGRGMYTLDEQQNTYNMLGFRSVGEAKHLEAIYYDKWAERQNKKELEKVSQGILAHFTLDKDTKTILTRENIWRKNLLKLVELGGEEAVKHLATQIEQNATASQYDYFVQELRQLQNEKDYTKAKRNAKRITESRRLAE